MLFGRDRESLIELFGRYGRNCFVELLDELGDRLHGAVHRHMAILVRLDFDRSLLERWAEVAAPQRGGGFLFRNPPLAVARIFTTDTRETDHCLMSAGEAEVRRD